jgi:hypothetical protein
MPHSENADMAGSFIPPVRADLNVAGAAPANVAVAEDPVGHHRPAPGPAPGHRPPSPPAPTEQELRQRLAEASVHECEAADRLAQVQGAADRARRHLQGCESALRDFESLDDEIATRLVGQLTDARPVESSDPIRERVAAREHARTDLAGAIRAHEVLTGDLAKAQALATASTKAVEQICAQVLSHEAERIAATREALIAQAADLLGRL